MIDVAAVEQMLQAEGLHTWAERISRQLEQVLEHAPHGDWRRWRQTLDSLPGLGPGQLDCATGAVRLVPSQTPAPGLQQALRDGLRALHPWRKGPYQIGDIRIDSEWRSDWKWQRILPALSPLQGRRILDVGCGNGYHCWRLADAGARRVIGIDPTALFLAQFLAIHRLAEPLAPGLAGRVHLLPLALESVPEGLEAFDTVLSMGVLYHRRSPIDHLLALRGALRPGGQLVLETLVIQGRDDQLLLPAGRYAKMRNVWFIPTPGMLRNWLQRSGFRAVQIVDVSTTTVQEQRRTEWMTFESLADFLDPADRRYTVEGYPAPSRAVLIAEV